VKTGDSVLGTYRYAVGSAFIDTRMQGTIDSRRLPLGYYWLVFASPEGQVRQMNHESEIRCDPRKVESLLHVLACVRLEAANHFRAGGAFLDRHGRTYRVGRSPEPVEVPDGEPIL
jgi:hypothetical protein